MAKNTGLWILRAIQGALIGVGAILPGVSGGVLCVLFGIYRPMMELFSHPAGAIKKYWRLLLAVGIGWVLGFFGLAKLVELFFESSPKYMVCLFFGLIVGTLPSLYRDAGRQGRTKGSGIGLAAGFVGLTALLLTIRMSAAATIEPNIWWFLFCGGVWGLSLIVPGLSSSSILIFLGLYQPMTAGIANFSPEVIIPLLIGVVLAALGLARGVNALYERKYSVVSHVVLGLVAASAVMIIPLDYAGIGEGLLCLLCAAAGFAAAVGLDKLGGRITKADEQGEMNN